MPELEDFIAEFRLTRRQSARLFNRSPRTLRRWRRRGRLPRAAADLVEICREQRAPINYSVPRGPSIGVQIYSFRERLFGPSWKDWRAEDYPSSYRRRRL